MVNRREHIACPRCGCCDLPVLATRHRLGAVIRYRRCRHCGRSLKTWEVMPQTAPDSISGIIRRKVVGNSGQ